MLFLISLLHIFAKWKKEFSEFSTQKSSKNLKLSALNRKLGHFFFKSVLNRSMGFPLTFILPKGWAFLSLFLVRHIFTDKKRKILRKTKNTDKIFYYIFGKNLSHFFLSIFMKLTKIRLKILKTCFFLFFIT